MTSKTIQAKLEENWQSYRQENRRGRLNDSEIFREFIFRKLAEIHERFDRLENRAKPGNELDLDEL